MRSATIMVKCDTCGVVSTETCDNHDGDFLYNGQQGWWYLAVDGPQDKELSFDVCPACVTALVEDRLAAAQPQAPQFALLDGAFAAAELEQARAEAAAERARKEAEMREGMVVVGPVTHRDDRPTPPAWTIDKFVPLVVSDASARSTWLACLKCDAHVHCTDNGTHCGALGVIVAHDDDPTGTFFVQFSTEALRALPPGMLSTEPPPAVIYEFARATGAYVKRDGIGPAHFPQLQPIGRVSQAPVPPSPLVILSQLLSADEERAVDDMILANDESESDDSDVGDA